MIRRPFDRCTLCGRMLPAVRFAAIDEHDEIREFDLRCWLRAVWRDWKNRKREAPA